MTEQEAIERIEEFGLHHAICDLPFSKRTVEAFEMAIQSLNGNIYQEIRNKAIDDFYESIVEAYKQMKSIPDIEKATLNTIAMGIRERLKEGGSNE